MRPANFMKLFLTSSGLSENLSADFFELVGKEPTKMRFYYIPTAVDVEENKFYTVKSMDDFADVGINPVWYALRSKTKNVIERELADADVIWVGGGNTFYLLDVARRVGFMDVVEDLVRNKGVIYGGSSAGTILTNPSIDIAGWGHDADPNKVGLTDLTSFGFLNARTQVHYNPQVHDAMLRKAQRDLPLYLLPDGSALRVDNETVDLLGGAAIMH